MKEFLYKILQSTNLDFKSINKRIARFGSRHSEPSAIYSLNKEAAKPTSKLLNVFCELIIQSPGQPVHLFKNRRNIPNYVYEYPGEHYLVIEALVKVIDARNIIEIGTFTGLSSLAFFQVMDESRRLTTFDIVAWNEVANTVLLEEDFQKYNFNQVLTDLSNLENIQRHTALFQNADLIFCDGPKDGHFEKQLLLNFASIGIKNGCILFFDDIRQWNMLKTWYDIKMPKLDISSIGHFTGSGLIEWNNNIACF